MLDTVRLVETPEGVSLALRPAGPIPRGFAWIIDLLIRAVAYIALWLVLAQLEEFGVGVYLVLIFLLEWFYPVLFEVFDHGKTIGKGVMKIRVVHDDGAPVGWTGSMIRNLLRTVDFLPFLYGTGLLCMFIHPEFKRLGDVAAGTLVVHDDRVEASPVLEPVDPERPPILLSVEQQRALLEFAARSQSMPPARCVELAELLEPLTGQRGEPGVVKLKRIAAWLAGGGDSRQADR